MPLLLQLRALATIQPGYISGRTLGEIGKLDELLVISSWESIDSWNSWLKNEDRQRIDQKIEALSGVKAEYKMYEFISFYPESHGK